MLLELTRVLPSRDFNSYYLATAAQDSTVKIWDLRKLKNVHTIDLGFVPTSVTFESTGAFLAVTGAVCALFMPKSFEKVAELQQEHEVTGAVFGPGAQSIVTTSTDRSLRVFSAPS